MLKLQVIGNLGANAEIKGSNGKEFITFRVADTKKFVDDDGVIHEQTNWINCAMNVPSQKFLTYLIKGTKVFVEGRPSFRTFKATRDGRTDYYVSVDLSVTNIELCGGTKKEENLKPNEPF